MLSIRAAERSDEDAIWQIFAAVIQEGDTYVYPASITKAEALSHWMKVGNYCYVAEEDKKILGTYYLCANFTGKGSHVANASFMVSKDARGKGVGEKMALNALDEAKSKGFISMQFNLVVSTNQIAVKLWKKLGFEIVGVIPRAYQHSREGLVDAYIMFKDL